MKIQTNSQPIPRPPELVYRSVMDPAVLSDLIPGIEKFESVGDDVYEVVMKLGVGAIRGDYTGTVKVTDKRPPEAYKLSVDAKGKTGWARGDAEFSLIFEDGSTIVSVNANVQVGGTIAGVGQRMIEGIAKSMAREFFKALESYLLEGGTETVSQGRFGFRIVVGLIRDFFARLFGRDA